MSVPSLVSLHNQRNRLLLGVAVSCAIGFCVSFLVNMLCLVSENTLKSMGNVHNFNFNDVDFGWNLVIRTMFIMSYFLRLICVSFLASMRCLLSFV